jgi:hypothetical protein
MGLGEEGAKTAVMAKQKKRKARGEPTFWSCPFLTVYAAEPRPKLNLAAEIPRSINS